MMKANAVPIMMPVALLVIGFTVVVSNSHITRSTTPELVSTAARASVSGPPTCCTQ
jgi:hypothetical protein